MMYKVIENKDEIKECQEKFKKILTNPKETKVFKDEPHGDPDGSIKVDKYWSSKFEFWYAYVPNEILIKKRENTHINLLGLSIKETTVEINFPVKGINRQLKGIFARNDKDKVIVVHRGKFQRNLKEGGRSSPKNYNGERIDILDGDRETNVILVGELHSPDFLESLSNFIKEVGRIKKNTKSMPINKPKEEANGEIDDNGKPKNNGNTRKATSIKEYMDSDTVPKYYNKLLDNYDMKTDLANKVSMLKKLMEREILKEVTGINHYDDLYDDNNVITKSGQRKWLVDNREKRNKNGGILNGFVPKVIVSGIQNIFDWRNIAEHNDEEILYSTYLGLFTIVAKTIASFSKTDIPEEIMDICNGNKQKTP